MTHPRHRLQFGSTIVEISGGESGVFLTISKERYVDDAVQVRIPARGAVAVANLLMEVAESTCD